jgi:hypothetical protein
MVRRDGDTESGDAEREGQRAEGTTTPPQFGVFLIRLPYRLPIPHGSTFLLELPGDLGPDWGFHTSYVPKAGAQGLPIHLRIPFVSLKLWQHETTTIPGLHVVDVLGAVLRGILPPETLSRPEDVSPDPISSIQNYETVVEAITQLPAQSGGESAAFDRCLVAINRLVLAYSYVQKDPMVHPLSVRQLDPWAILIRRSINAPTGGRPIVYATGGLNFETVRPPLSAEDTGPIAEYLSLIARGHPLTPTSQFVLERARAQARGDHAATVIWSGIWMEVVLNTILRLMLAEEGRSSEIDDVFRRKGGLRGRLEREFPPRLGGVWQTREGSASVTRWWLTCQTLRGRVVHAGYLPSEAEARAAALSSGALDAYVGDRLAAVRYRYPITAYTRLGLPGLARRGALSPRMRRVISEISPKLEEVWIASVPLRVS